MKGAIEFWAARSLTPAGMNRNKSHVLHQKKMITGGELGRWGGFYSAFLVIHCVMGWGRDELEN